MPSNSRVSKFCLCVCEKAQAWQVPNTLNEGVSNQEIFVLLPRVGANDAICMF